MHLEILMHYNRLIGHPASAQAIPPSLADAADGIPNYFWVYHALLQNNNPHPSVDEQTIASVMSLAYCHARKILRCLEHRFTQASDATYWSDAEGADEESAQACFDAFKAILQKQWEEKTLQTAA